jgi:transposase
VETVEIIRRWQAGESQRQIASHTGLARNTVAKYLKAALALGLTPAGPLPSEGQLARLARLGDTTPATAGPAPTDARLLAHRDRIAAWLHQDRLQLTRIQEKLAAVGCPVPYTSLRRFVARQGWLAAPRSTVRVAESAPGECAEMDFGQLGHWLDPATRRKRAVWALVVVLVYSRHLLVWPLFEQTLPAVIEGLEATWRFFGGVPRRLVLDNFPAAVAQADPLTPRLTKGFLEYAQFRGFLADPTRPRHPQDKPHVERAVPYARERFFKGGQFASLPDFREQALRWSRDVAGQRVHGTTHRLPLVVFRDEEQAHLLPLGDAEFVVPQWRALKVHPDHHVDFLGALYSVPAERCPPGTRVEVRGDPQVLKIYHQGRLVKEHLRQPKGGRVTDPADYPAERTTYALRAPDRVRQQARALGPAVGDFAARLLAEPFPWAKLRQGQKLLRLAERYGAARLDDACRRALAFELLDVRRVERILVQALEREALPTREPATPPPPPARFARPGAAFAHQRQEERR